MPESAAKAFCLASTMPLAGVVLGDLADMSPLVWLGYLLSAILSICGVVLVVRGVAGRANTLAIALVTIATLIAVAPLGVVAVLLAVADPMKGILP